MNSNETLAFKEALKKNGYENLSIYGGIYPSKSIYDDNAFGSALRVTFKEVELIPNEQYCFFIRIEVSRDFGDSLVFNDKSIGYNSIEEIEQVAKSFHKWCCDTVPLLPPLKIK